MRSENQQFIELKLEYSEPLKLLIEKHLSFDWCKEKLFVPYEFKKSDLNKSVKVSIAISNFCVLADEGGKIKKAIRKAGFVCQFAETNKSNILSILKGLEDTVT